jgi:hypothetical protein
MILVGFGCSFTYGSELESPDIDPNDRRAFNRHRESHVWLGLLSKRFGYSFDNRAEPANSNYAIAQQVTEYVRVNAEHYREFVVCIAWSAHPRFSWYDNKWTHNGFADNDWALSAREWLTRSTDASHNMFTTNAKLIVNSVCAYHNVKLLQFNALGDHKSEPYSNYFCNGTTMADSLNPEHFASGGHPNELGHEVWTNNLAEWITSKGLL